MSRSQIHLKENTEDLIFIRPEILLEPQLVKPLHGLNPRTILGQRWWDEQRQVAYRKNNYHCWTCGTKKDNIEHVQKRLEAHESYKVDVWKCSYELQEIIALCPLCHSYIHFGRTSILHRNKQITEELINIIYNHGNDTLNKYGLDASDAWWYYPEVAQQLLPEKIGTWNKWHLIINGKKYESKFKNYEEWKSFYKEGKPIFVNRIWEDPTTGNRIGGSYSGSRSTRKGKS